MDTVKVKVKRPPTLWRRFLSESFHQKGKSSKLPKRGTDEYNTLIANYITWKENLIIPSKDK